MKTTKTITVPASSANLGPGFDTLGLALGLYNTIEVQPAEALSIEVHGLGAAVLPTDENNMLLRAFLATTELLGAEAPAVHLAASPPLVARRNAFPCVAPIGRS